MMPEWVGHTQIRVVTVILTMIVLIAVDWRIEIEKLTCIRDAYEH